MPGTRREKSWCVGVVCSWIIGNVSDRRTLSTVLGEDTKSTPVEIKIPIKIKELVCEDKNKKDRGWSSFTELSVKTTQ